MSFRVGFDVGGTFTDFVLQSASGELHTGKRLTTYPDPSLACLEGLDALIAHAGVAWTDLGQAVHGTTLGSNIIIERKGADVALLTTRGFRDVLIIGREKRYQLYDLFIEKPAPLVPRSRIREGTERGALPGGGPPPTVVNALVMPAVRDFLERLDRALADLGYRGRLFVMQSGGGIATAETMDRFPARMIESGPAAGAPAGEEH